MFSGLRILYYPLSYCKCAGQKENFNVLYRTYSHITQHGVTNSTLLNPVLSPFNQVVRSAKRGMDFQPNTYKRIKKHGWDKKMKSLGGQITIIRRMIRGVPRRKLTH